MRFVQTVCKVLELVKKLNELADSLGYSEFVMNQSLCHLGDSDVLHVTAIYKGAQSKREGGIIETPLGTPSAEGRRDHGGGEPMARAPLCPRCETPMEIRTAGKGPNIGQKFWGCGGYPQCHGTRPYSDQIELDNSGPDVPTNEEDRDMIPF